MSKLRLWQQHHTWEEAAQAWDEGAQKAEATHPLRTLKAMPSMVGITEETKKHLKWKSLKWMILQDDGSIRKHFLKHPFKYGFRFIRSLLREKAYLKREGDLFFYGTDEFHLSKDAIFVLGFSYCHKPYECPCGRFTTECIHDADHPTCRQCFIGKCVHASPRDTKVLWITTIHYVGHEIFKLLHAHPQQKLQFIITACELTLEMFGDLGNMVGIEGIGVRLDGRICNTMKAFELSEKGIKPGLTIVTDETKDKILSLLKSYARLKGLCDS